MQLENLWKTTYVITFYDHPQEKHKLENTNILLHKTMTTFKMTMAIKASTVCRNAVDLINVWFIHISLRRFMYPVLKVVIRYLNATCKTAKSCVHDYKVQISFEICLCGVFVGEFHFLRWKTFPLALPRPLAAENQWNKYS